jgi:hypothetical protein
VGNKKGGKMKRISLMLALVTISGCAYNLTLMPRDSGKTYMGEMQGNGAGSATLTVQLDDATCTGPGARVASNQSFGFANTYGTNSRGASTNAFTTTQNSGDSQVKAILSCSNGSGLRCDMTGQGAAGGGICVDDKGRVYDILAIRK